MMLYVLMLVLMLVVGFGLLMLLLEVVGWGGFKCSELW